MPTYQYACTACGHQLEVVQSFTDEPLTECPECEGRLRKLFSAVGIVFKGSGFYRTDSRPGEKVSAGDGAGNGSASGAKSDGAKGEGAKSDGAKGEGAKSGGAKKEPASASAGSSSAPSASAKTPAS
ncbi:MAG: FmdB family zinc ribbon protein [Micromonosporaceae bacterium]